MTVRTRAQLNSDADTLLPDNTAGEISPEDVRERIKDLADSAKLAEDSATTSAQGIVELATVAEALAGTDAVRAVTPSGLYYPTGHLFGLTLSNNGSDATNDIDIAAGTCRDGSDTQNLICSAMTKQLDANWAPGTNAGGRYSGVAIANGTYHWYACGKALGASQDYYAHPSGSTDAQVLAHLQAETGGSAYLYVRRIGSIIRASAAILPFVQTGDKFRLNTAIVDVNASSPGASAVTRTLSTPAGLVTRAILSVGMFYTTTRSSALVSPLTATDQAAQDPTVSSLTGFAQVAGASNTVVGGWNFSAESEIETNTSSQVRSRTSAGGASDRLGIVTFGWIDTRGRAA